MEGQLNAPGPEPNQTRRQPEAQRLEPVAAGLSLLENIEHAITNIGGIKTQYLQTVQTNNQKYEAFKNIVQRQAAKIQRLNRQVGELSADNQRLVTQNSLAQRFHTENVALRKENADTKVAVNLCKQQIAVLESDKSLLQQQLLMISDYAKTPLTHKSPRTKNLCVRQSVYISSHVTKNRLPAAQLSSTSINAPHEATNTATSLPHIQSANMLLPLRTPRDEYMDPRCPP